MKWNRFSCLTRFVKVTTALSTPFSHDDGAEAMANKVIKQLYELCTAVSIPKGLRSLGIKPQCISALAIEAIKVARLLRNNPRKLPASDIKQTYQET